MFCSEGHLIKLTFCFISRLNLLEEDPGDRRRVLFMYLFYSARLIMPTHKDSRKSGVARKSQWTRFRVNGAEIETPKA